MRGGSACFEMGKEEGRPVTNEEEKRAEAKDSEGTVDAGRTMALILVLSFAAAAAQWLRLSDGLLWRRPQHPEFELRTHLAWKTVRTTRTGEKRFRVGISYKALLHPFGTCWYGIRRFVLCRAVWWDALWASGGRKEVSVFFSWFRRHPSSLLLHKKQRMRSTPECASRVWQVGREDGGMLAFDLSLFVRSFVLTLHFLSVLSYPFGSVRFGSVRFGSVRFGSVRFGSVRFGSVRFGLVWFGLVRVGSVGFELVSSVRVGYPTNH